MIFEKFHRLGDELRRTTPGTGLGLYIVKRLVELSGGTVHAAQRRAWARRDGLDALAGAARAPMKSAAARILVVDDEAHLAAGIRENLEAEGYRADVAHDGTRGPRAPARRAVRPRRARRDDAEHGRPRALRAAAPRRHSDAGAVPHRERRRRGPRARLRSRRRRLSREAVSLEGAAAARRRDPAPQLVVSGERVVRARVRRQSHRLQDLRSARLGRLRALADAQGSDDPARARGRSPATS